MRIDKAKGQVLWLGCKNPMQRSRLGEQRLESYSAEGDLGVLLESWLDMSHLVPRWPKKPHYLVCHIFYSCTLSLLYQLRISTFLPVVIFGSLPAGNVFSLVYLSFPFSFLVFCVLFILLAVCPEFFFLYPSFIIWITVFPSTLSIFLVLYSTFLRMPLQSSAV